MINKPEENTEEYFEALWNEYEPAIRRLCRRKLTGNRADVDEIVAQTYLNLCEAVAAGKTINNPKPWLYGTANNLIKRKYAEIKKYNQMNRTLSPSSYELAYDFDYLDKIITDEDILELKKSIEEELNENERLLLKFVYEDKLKTRDIAKIINTSEFAVKQRRYRLNKRIKELAKDKIKNFL